MSEFSPHILKKALNDAVAQPVAVTKQYEYDWLGYYDAIHLACDMVEKTNAKWTLVDKIDSLDINEGFYKLNIDGSQGQPFSENQLIANHELIVLVRHIPVDFDVSRLIGSHYRMIPTKKLFENKNRTLIVPFELISVVNPKQLGNNTLQYAYLVNPLDAVFKHYITPASVMGIGINKDINQIIGYVTHARQMANLLNVPENKLNSLQYDTANAMKLLKYRYNIMINDEIIKAIDDFENKISTHEGTAYFELFVD